MGATRFLVGALAAGLLFFPAGCREKPAGPRFKKEYRMQVTVGPQTAWGMGASRFADLVREKTGGRVVVKPYFGSQLLKGAQLNVAQMVASGAIDAAFESTINTAPVIPELNLFSLPFFVGSHENVDRMEVGEAGRLLFGAMRAKGLEPLAWGENGFRQLTNSRHPVRTPEDMEGLRVRIVGSPLFVDIMRDLGADPINMNWGDAVTSFQQGTVDAQENPVNILTSVQIFQYHQFVTLWNYVIDPLVIYWSAGEWAEFPGDVQEAIRAAAVEAGRYQKALARVGLDGRVSLQILKDEFGYVPEIEDPVEYLRQKGMTVEELTAAERELFRRATEPATSAWVDRIGRAVYEAARKDIGDTPGQPR